MSKGASQTGTQTTTSVDPRAQYQAPYLQSGWQSAEDIWRGTQLNPQGYNAQWSAGANQIPQAADAAAQPFNAAVTGQYGGQYSPAYGGYQNVAGGNTYGQQLAGSGATQAYNLAPQSVAAGQRYGGLLENTAAGTQAALADPLQKLQQQSSGYYLNNNPYLDATYGKAADAVTQAYQTGTAPRTGSSYELAGRYGSPSAQNAVTQNERTLGTTLSGLATDIYGKNYATERGLQNAATVNLGTLGTNAQDLMQRGYGAASNQTLAGYGQGGTQYTGAGNLGLSGTSSQLSGLGGLASGWDTGNKAALQGTSLLPTMQAGYGYGPGLQQQAIAGLQQQQWDPLQQYMKIITQPAGYQATTSQQPIYGSSAGQALGGFGSLLSGAGSIGAMFGSGGVFSSDRRLKEDTRVVGHVGRLPLYTFRYKGEAPGTKRIGFMADEVERIDPGAVATTNLGFKAVDYGRAAVSALKE